ncbi:FeoC-like transcriptional regulator [Treponema primitia]|uniref:FeoC-like transcriptional regulator n=1 Tax=Treponema primitia TaxID=88058 RepID=UPI00397FB00C
MLEALLTTLNSTEMRSLQEIALTLHISTETAKAGLEFLEHQGYIKKTVSPPSCPGKSCYGCNGCSSILPLPLMWEKI